MLVAAPLGRYILASKGTSTSISNVPAKTTEIGSHWDLQAPKHTSKYDYGWDLDRNIIIPLIAKGLVHAQESKEREMAISAPEIKEGGDHS